MGIEPFIYYSPQNLLLITFRYKIKPSLFCESVKTMNFSQIKQAKGITENLGSLKAGGTRKNSVGAGNKYDLFQFSLPTRSSFSATLANLKADANLTLLNSNRAPLAASKKRGTQAEAFSTVLEPGTYYIQVKAIGKGTTPFTLSYNLTTDDTQIPVNADSFNTLPGRTSRDYFRLATLARDAIYEFYLGDNIISTYTTNTSAYTLFSGIGYQFATYADQGDRLALTYLQNLEQDVSYAIALKAAQSAYSF
jgi:Bacterial pre-peptidase C-terminal domain